MKRLLVLALVQFALISGAGAATSAIAVTDAWSRPAPETAVVYATLHNSGSSPDRLIGATSPIATHVTLHQSFETKSPDMAGMSGMPMGPMMSMRRLSSIPIPPAGTTKLAPGGYHLMLDLRHDLKAGQTIPLRLHFQQAGWIAFSVPVRPI